MATSILSKIFELGPILPNLTKIRRVHAPKSLASAENWLNCQEKLYSFLQNLLRKFLKMLGQFWAIRGNTGSLPQAPWIIVQIAISGGPPIAPKLLKF